MLDELSEILLMDRRAAIWLVASKAEEEAEAVDAGVEGTGAGPGAGAGAGAALLAHVVKLVAVPHHAVVSAAMDLLERDHPVAAAMAAQPAPLRAQLAANLRHTIEHNWNNDVKVKAREVLDSFKLK